MSSWRQGRKYTTLVSRVPEYIVVNFNLGTHLNKEVSAPDVRWRARAGALARAGAEAPASACKSKTHVPFGY
jgi:hypothetical protein